MKNIFISCLTLLLLLSSSCEKYLDTPQYGDILPKTIEDYSALIHSHLKSMESTDQYYIGSYRTAVEQESYTDNLNASLATSFDLSAYVGVDLPKLQYRFSNFYANIKDFNIVLDQIGQPGNDFEKKLVATSLSLRALSYFNLMREFCNPYMSHSADTEMGLPLVRQFDLEYFPERSSLKSTADFIIKDLHAALAIGQHDEVYKFTDDINRAILARVLHWTQHWEEAIKLSEDILSRYTMIEGQDFIDQAYATVGEKSGSVLIRSYTTGSASGMTTFKRRLTSRPVNLDFLDSFQEEARDIRYQCYFDNNLLNLKSPQGWIRVEEMALIAAEAYAHLGNEEKALYWLNTLRDKRIRDNQAYTMASLPPVGTNLITVDSEGKELTPLMAAILRERRKELYLEGDRWFELKRNGRPEFWVGFNGIKYETKKFLYTYPINRSEILLNPKIKQNQGYENL